MALQEFQALAFDVVGPLDDFETGACQPIQTERDCHLSMRTPAKPATTGVGAC